MHLTIGLLLAVLVNFGLFTLMQQMTSTNSAPPEPKDTLRADFVRSQQQPRTETTKRELPTKPPLPKKPPPPTALTFKANKPKNPSPQADIPRIDIEVPLNIAGSPYLGDFLVEIASAVPLVATPPPILDDEVIPLVRIDPRYPRLAARMGIEGVVTVSFTITKNGGVRDPVIISATPENIFDKAVLKAILKWKFKPKIVDGKPVERKATQDIEFKLQ